MSIKYLNSIRRKYQYATLRCISVLTSRRLLHTLLVVSVVVLLLYLVNPWVYAFKPTYIYTRDILTGRTVQLFEFECIGFKAHTTLLRNIRIIPGELLCYDEEGRGVYESLRLILNITLGHWVYSDIVLLYINTSRNRYLEIVVEKPLETVNLTVVLSNSRDKSLLVAFNLSEYKRLRIEVPTGLNTYTITLVVEATRPVKGVFRVGFYIGISGD